MSTQRILSWDINSINQERQEVMRSIDGGESTVLATLSATATSHADDEVLTPNSTVVYQVASIATINGLETRVLSDTIEHTVPSIKAMSGETRGEMFMGMFTQPVELKIDGVVIPESAEEPGLYMYALDPLQPKPFTIRPLTAGEPLVDVYVEGGIGKVNEWYPDGHSGIIMLGMNTIQVPAELHPSITTLSGMFAGAADFNDPNVSNWDTSNITNMEGVFNGAATFNQPLHWTTTAVTNTKDMFGGAAAFNSDISDMNFTSITEMARMFRGATAFNQPVAGKFNLTNVTRPQGVFESATSFNQPIDWDFSNVIDLWGFFTNATSFNQDISGWNVSKVSEFQEMFMGATGFDMDLSAWNVSGGYGMTNMFADTTYLDRHDLSAWCVAHIPYPPSGFEGTATTPAHLPVWGTCPRGENVILDNMMFTTTAGSINYQGYTGDKFTLSDGSTIVIDSSENTPITVPVGTHTVAFVSERSGVVALAGDVLTEINTFPTHSSINHVQFKLGGSNSPYLIKVPTTLPSNLTNLSSMFLQAYRFNQDISGWDVSHVTEMTNMFDTAAAFNKDISGWNVSKVTNMDQMFYGAPYFNQDLSQWCVGLISVAPMNFSTGSPLLDEHLPVWGTCPRGENQV